MDSIALIAVAGPPGSGKTTWLSQFLQDQHRPLFYCCPGMGACSVDQARIAYRFPWVYVIPESQAPQVLADLPDQALVYFELGFHLDLASPLLASLPCHRVAVRWLRSLHFGFHELDCLLIHGSTVSYADELTPDTPAIQLCDRLIRADANTLFCRRSGLTFECWVTPNELRSTVTTLDGTQEPQGQGKTPRRVVGVGSVGRTPKQATYTLYNPSNNQVTFRTVFYSQVKGFGVVL
jgi:hypothetical protein